MTRFTLIVLAVFTVASYTLADQDTKCSFDKIADDVKRISTQTLALDDQVQQVNYHSQGKQVTAHVHNEFQGLAKAIEATANDMKPCPAPFSNDTFQTLLSSVQTIIGEETKAMKDIVAKKPVFDALGGVSPVIKKDLDNLHSSSLALENVWLAKAPNQHKDEAQKLVNEINNVLAFAQAAYAYA
ncbi:hypothetical protein L218DRAFT_968103 [Marasmius fiardii PR-910]|nr:hypothetical protein L218DRAFT_968103 [Marasmius fiardii PR-910]